MKRFFTFLAAAVMAAGAWGQEPTEPTMYLTVNVEGSSALLTKQPMTKTSENHWKLDIATVSKTLATNKRYAAQAIYDKGDGSATVNSGWSSVKPLEDGSVTFYAKYDSENGKTLVSCDGMSQNFAQNNWRTIGQLGPAVGQTESNPTYLNIFYSGSHSYQQTDNVPNTSADAIYYINFKTAIGGGAVRAGGSYVIGGKPSINPGQGIFRAVNNFVECTVELTKVDTYPLVISEAGAATLSLPYAVTLPSPLKAYKLRYGGGTTLNAVLVENGEIAANTPVLINGPAGTYNLNLTGDPTYTTETIDGQNFIKDIEPSPEDNVLHGVIVPHFVRTPDGDNYVLQYNDGKVGFFKVTGTTTYQINAFRAFVHIPTATPARLSIVYDDSETTGIETVKATKTGDGAVYNLSGQRVSSDYKGVVIKNGRKMIQK